MRDEDTRDSDHLELGHVYERLKKLEDGQAKAQETLQAVQLKLTEVAATGARFPGWLPAAMVAIILFLAGQTGTAVWWASGVDTRVTGLPDLQARLTSAFNGMRNAETALSSVQSEHVRLRDLIHSMDRECCHEVPVIHERLKNLEGKIVGRSETGWHRPDHELYAQAMDERFKRLESEIARLGGKR